MPGTLIAPTANRTSILSASCGLDLVDVAGFECTPGIRPQRGEAWPCFQAAVESLYLFVSAGRSV